MSKPAFTWKDTEARAEMTKRGKPYIQGNDMSRYWFLKIRLELEQQERERTNVHR